MFVPKRLHQKNKRIFHDSKQALRKVEPLNTWH